MTVHLTWMISALLSLSIVTPTDCITADFYPFDIAFLGAAATRISVNRVLYDVTPGTIE